MRIILSLILLLTSYCAEAIWTSPEDASVNTEFFNSDTKVNLDGTSESIIEIKEKIINELGRSQYSEVIHYNGDTTKIKILDAYTIYQGKKYKVAPNKIEDKPLASTRNGFDQQRQIMVSFPKLEIGAETYIKYSSKNTATTIDNFFNSVAWFGDGRGCIYSGEKKISSKLPLFFEVNDPTESLDVTKSENNKLYNINVKVKKPICTSTYDGSEIGIIHQNKFTWVAISSLNDWNEYAKKVATKYETVSEQALPTLFQDIFEEAKKEQDEISQINLVTSRIMDKIKYMGNWVSIKGKFYPRDLEVIAKAQEADCKEFSTSTSAILKKLGYKVQAAFVERSNNSYPVIQKIPTDYNFNHVFIKVTGKKGDIYWVDPTNRVSMAQGIFPDIANRMILILDSKNPSYEKSPAIDPSHSQVILNKVLEIDGKNMIFRGNLTLKGESALEMAGRRLFYSEKEISDNIYNQLSDENLPDDQKKELILPDLMSRNVKDLDFKFKYEVKNGLIKTNLGYAFEISANWSSYITDYIEGQLSDINISDPLTISKSLTIKNIQLKDVEKLNYQLDSSWVSIKRDCKVEGNDSVITDTIIFKKSFITSEELKTPEYLALKAGIEENIKNVAVILP